MVKTTFLIEMFFIHFSPVTSTADSTISWYSRNLHPTVRVHNQPVKTIVLKCRLNLLHRLPANLFSAKYIYRRLSVFSLFAPFVTASPDKMIITFMRTFH